MGACCCKDTPSFSFKDCLKDINIKSSCMSSCCVKGDSKVENKHHNKNHHKHHHKHHHKENEIEIKKSPQETVCEPPR